MKKNKMKILKIIIFILLILLLVFLTIKLGPLFKNISTEKGRIEFRQKIESLGFEGVLTIIGLIFVQIFLPILPGEPVELLSGMCFGPVGGLIVCYLGVFLSTFFIYFAVRKFGKEFIYSFISKDKIDKMENSDIWDNSKKIDIILFMAFFVPGTPKDIFVYIGGLLPINSIKFLFISTFARFPSIISSTIAGSNIIYGNWRTIILAYIITFGISGIVLFLYNKNKHRIILQKNSLKKVNNNLKNH